ncbi:TPA: DNA-binding protein [Escherichia coli]
MALTKQDIWRCADELDAEGIRPTLAAVRKKLGSGSFTTISDAMAEWKSRKAVALPSPEPLPVTVSEQLAEFGNALWAIALANANARLDEDRKQIEADKAAISQQLAEAVELADTLTRENDQLREQIEQLEPMARERDKLADQLAEVKRRSADELNRCMEKVTRRDNEAIEARKQAKEASERAASLQGQVEVLKEQIANLTAALKSGGKQ